MQSLNAEIAVQSIQEASDLKSLIAAFSQATVKQIKGDQVAEKDLIDHGRVSYVVTVKGQEVKTAFKLVDASDLITSNSLDGKINAAYPQELQPRDRTRAASIMQITKLSKSLRPVQLADSGLSSHGAPIIGSDRVVESGNGRSMAIIKAYADGNAEDYRKYLIDNAELYGLKREDVKRMEQPVLVRVRLDEVDRLQFTKDSNISDLQAMSPVELARVDAENLDEKTMGLFSPSESGDLLAASNLPFIQAFMAKLGTEQAAGYMTADGRPTKQVIDRIQGAIFAKAYQNEKLLKLSVEEPDPEIRNVLTALNAAAPDFIAMRYLSGEAHKQTAESVAGGVDMNSNLDEQALSALVDAATIVRSAKATGQNINEYLSQGALFGDNDPSASALAKFIADNNRSAKRMGEAFKLLAGEINAELTHQGQAAGDMFGAPPLDLITVLARVSEKMQEQYGENAGMSLSLFDSVLAAKIDAAAQLVNTDPTIAQQQAGNYAKGHVDFYGLPLTFENPRGSVRRGMDCNGKEWESQMQHHYGYIKRTTGADGDHVDFFLGDELDSDQVFIVNQIDQGTGSFDEHKVMLGFPDRHAAHDAYLSNYEAGWNGAESIHQLHIDDFKEWLVSGDQSGPYQSVSMFEAVNKKNGNDVIREFTTKATTLNKLLIVFDSFLDGFQDEVASHKETVLTLAKTAKKIEAELASKHVVLIFDLKRLKATLGEGYPAKYYEVIKDNLAAMSNAFIQEPNNRKKILTDGMDKITSDLNGDFGVARRVIELVKEPLRAYEKELKESPVLSGYSDLVNDLINESPVSESESKLMTERFNYDFSGRKGRAFSDNYQESDLKNDIAKFLRLTNGSVQQGIKFTTTGDRAYADWFGELNVGKATDSVVVWHELGHFIEYKNPFARQQARNILLKRYNGITKGRKIMKLSTLTKCSRYKPDEKALVSGFYCYYMGKVYGELPTVDLTEIISMGFGALAKPSEMRKMSEQDPECLAMILAIVKRLHLNKGE